MRYLLPLTTLIFILACGSNKSEAEKQKVPEEEEVTATLMWRADIDNDGKISLTHDKPVMYDTLNVDRVIELSNSAYPQVQLKLDRISNDTVFVSIPEATYLTQQMGSTGPTVYFADIVFNLTELPGIRYVSFYFEEGDHATPGVESRESIKKDYEPVVNDNE
jgi:hypothetical protein